MSTRENRTSPEHTSASTQKIDDLMDNGKFVDFLDLFPDFENLDTSGENGADNEIIEKRFRAFEKLPVVGKAYKDIMREKLPAILKVDITDADLACVDEFLKAEVVGGNSEILDAIERQLVKLKTGRGNIAAREQALAKEMTRLGGKDMELGRLFDKLYQQDAHAREKVSKTTQELEARRTDEADKTILVENSRLAKNAESQINSLRNKLESQRKEEEKKAVLLTTQRLLKSQSSLIIACGDRLPDDLNLLTGELNYLAEATGIKKAEGRKGKNPLTLEGISGRAAKLEAQQQDIATRMGLSHMLNTEVQPEQGARQNATDLSADIETLTRLAKEAKELSGQQWDNNKANLILQGTESLNFHVGNARSEIQNNILELMRNSNHLQNDQQRLEILNKFSHAKPFLIVDRLMVTGILGKAKKQVEGGRALFSFGLKIEGTEEKIDSLSKAVDAKDKAHQAYDQAYYELFEGLDIGKKIVDAARLKRDQKLESFNSAEAGLKEALDGDAYFQELLKGAGEGEVITDKGVSYEDIANQDDNDDVIFKKREFSVQGRTWEQYKNDRVDIISLKWAKEVKKIADSLTAPESMKRSAIISKLTSMENGLGDKLKHPRYKEVKFAALERACADTTISRKGRQVLRNILGEMKRKAKSPEGSLNYAAAA